MNGRWSHCVIFFLFSTSALGAEDLLAKPILSLECKDILQRRNVKVVNRQKLTALIIRNKKIQVKLSKNKKTLKKKLQKNLVRLKQELHYTEDAIKYREEKLIRQGCPLPKKIST